MPPKKRSARGGPQEESPIAFSGQGTLYQRDEDNVYSPLGDVGDYRVEMKGDAKAGFSIFVYEHDEVVLEQPIGTSMTLGYYEASASVHWPAVVESEVVYFAFRFEDGLNSAGSRVSAANYMTRFVEIYNQCTYSVLTGQDVVDKDDEWFEYMGGVASVPLTQAGATEDPVYEVCLDKRSQARTAGTGTVCFAESLQYNNTVVVRAEKSRVVLDGHRFDQYGFSADDAMSIVGQGVDLTTKGVLLDDEERKMLMFGNEAGKVQELDLETGTVVQEYMPRDNFNVKQLTYAQKTPTAAPSVYTCLSNDVAFNIDTRLDPRRCVVTEEGKALGDYALKNPSFTCHATSSTGHLAIGAADGTVRLYSGPPGSRKENGKYNPKTAKTALATKTPITSLDMTADGHYLVATSNGFLLVINTHYLDDDNKSLDGFTGRMGKKKPQPIRLVPSPQQIAQMGGEEHVHFTGARFVTAADGREECVTATCGPFFLTWSLKAITISEETKRPVPSSCAATGVPVVTAAAKLPSTVTYVTDSSVAMVPLQLKNEAPSKSTRAWRWNKD